MSIDIIEAIHKWCPQIVQDFDPSPLIENSFELQSWIHATSPPSLPLNADVIYRWSFKRQRRKLIQVEVQIQDTKCERCDLAARLSLSIADNEDEELILTMGEENNSAVPILVNHHQGNSRRLLE